MKDMIILIGALTILAAITLMIIVLSPYTRDEASEQPTSELFWIDNNRVHIDSIIDCNPIYNNSEEVIGSWIRVSYGETVIHIECIDTDDYLWWEFKESWLMAFNDGIKESM